MNPAAIVMLALSADAFAATGKGAALHRRRWSEALRAGRICGARVGRVPGGLAGRGAEALGGPVQVGIGILQEHPPGAG
jgi:putative Mn2+ efflux pump MntP